MAKFEISSPQVSKICTALLTERREWSKVLCRNTAPDFRTICEREILEIDESLKIFGYTALQLELPST